MSYFVPRTLLARPCRGLGNQDVRGSTILVSPVLIGLRKLSLAVPVVRGISPGNFTWECMCSVGSICVTGLEPRDSRTLLARTFRGPGNRAVKA